MNIVNVGYDSTNYYALGEPTTWLLVDVGWPGTLPNLLANLKRKDISFQDIHYLLITHYHPDHAGLAQEVKDRGVRLIVLESQIHAIPLLKTYMKPTNQYFDIRLDDNLNLSIAESRKFLLGIGIAGEIVSTPGHSADSITLVLDTGVAFTGDSLNPTRAENSYEIVTQSWQKLQSLNVTTLYPGHGPVRPSVKSKHWN
ncbi:hypothetical protein ANRL3_00776 [Anaerolineae bacterium]|nr:hypothetical protein ANRL3_00776 [Anaerolineae bacterium]